MDLPTNETDKLCPHEVPEYSLNKSDIELSTSVTSQHSDSLNVILKKRSSTISTDTTGGPDPSDIQSSIVDFVPTSSSSSLPQNAHNSGPINSSNVKFLSPIGFGIYQLSPELILRAEQEVNEKDSWRERDIQALRDMIHEQTILKSREDSRFLLEFLRARRFDYDNAFCLLCDYYRLALISPELYPPIEQLRPIFECNILARTPGRSNQDEAVILLRLGAWNLQRSTFDDILAACILALESTVDDDDITQINGILMVIDLDGFGWAHLRKFGPTVARKFIHTLENCLPIRLKGVLLINESTIASLLFSIMKPFMSEEFHNKIRFLGSSWKTTLHRQVRPEILPREFGGTLPSLSSACLFDELFDFERKKREDMKIYGFQNVCSQDLLGVVDRSCAPPICGRSERFSSRFSQAQVGVDSLDTTFFRKSNTCNGYLFDYSSSTSID